MTSRIIRFVVVLCLVSIVIVDLAAATDYFRETVKLTSSDRAPNDHLGTSVSLSGDAALVGAPDADEGIGAAYVFRFDGSGWVEEGKLTPSDGQLDQFGNSVSLCGDVALVGGYTSDFSSGAAYVYRFDGSGWVEEQRLIADDRQFGDLFGLSVSLFGDVALVGALGDDGSTGSAYVYRFDGSSWVQEQKITASDRQTNDDFGRSVSLYGEAALIGAPGDDSRAGSAYVYRFDGSSWAQEQKIVASDVEAHDNFGSAVSLCGDAALVGSANDDGATGSAYVYRFDGSGWVEHQKITASDAAIGDYFAFSVSLCDDAALVGATGQKAKPVRPTCIVSTDPGGWSTRRSPRATAPRGTPSGFRCRFAGTRRWSEPPATT